MSSKLLFAIVLVLLLLYALWKALTTNYTSLGSMQNANNSTTVPSSALPRNIPTSSSFSTWFFVRDWTCQSGGGTSTPKNILAVKNSQGSNLFSITLGSCSNELNVNVLCGTTASPGGVISTCSVSDFPLQKWVNVIVSLNGRAVDIFVDGKLVKTCVLDGVPKLSDTSQIILGGGFEGFLTNMKYKKDVISPQEAWDIYSEGYGGSPFGDLLNKYKIKLSFIVDNIEQTSVST